MKNMNSLFIITAFGIFIWASNSKAQSIPQKIEINSQHSVKENQILDLKASESICIREGFRMDKGSSLRLELTSKEDVNSHENDTKQLSIYPNPSSTEITVIGSFNNDLMTVFDGNGNPEMSIKLFGENPVINITELKNGVYLIKTSKSKEIIRLSKN